MYDVIQIRIVCVLFLLLHTSRDVAFCHDCVEASTMWGQGLKTGANHPLTNDEGGRYLRIGFTKQERHERVCFEGFWPLTLSGSLSPFWWFDINSRFWPSCTELPLG